MMALQVASNKVINSLPETRGFDIALYISKIRQVSQVISP